MATGCPAVLFTSGLMDFSFSALGDFSNNSCSSSKKHDRVQLKGAQPFRGQLQNLQNLRGDQSTNLGGNRNAAKRWPCCRALLHPTEFS